MKKIVFAIEQLYGGGAERVTAALASQLCDRAEVHLVTYKHEPCKEYSADPRIIRHNMPNSEGSGMGKILERIRFLRQVITQIDPDCVVSLALPRMVSLLTVAMLGKKVPVILSERNDPRRFPSQKILRLLRLWAYARCDGLVFQTHEAKDYFPASIAGQGVVICNPLTGKLPERYDGVRKPRIVNFCRLNAQKNLNLLLDAFGQIAGEFPEHQLYIYGEGSSRGELEQKIRDLGLEDRAFLPGYSENIYQDIRDAAMFVSSSDYEGISNSMLEAIALGVPTVCTDCPVGGARETIQNGTNGLLVPVGDRDAMVAAMRKILLDRDFAETISRNGCALRQTLSAQAIAEKWYEYIEQVVE